MIINNQSNVTYDYTLPDGSTVSGNQESNIVQTEVLNDVVTLEKTSDRTYLSEGESARQQVLITNNSQTTLTGITFKDVMTSGATYVAGSVMINGVSYPSYNPEIGFPLPDILPGKTVVVEYTIISNNPRTDESVKNNANIGFTVNDPERGPINYNLDSNTVLIALVSAHMTVEKSVDKAVAVRGETLRYTSIIRNTGSITQNNVFFRDVIPNGTSFISGSVTINGVSYPAYNPETGFSIGSLTTGESATVAFSVMVV